MNLSNRHQKSVSTLALAVALILSTSAFAAPAAGPASEVLLGVSQVQWVPSQEYAGMKLTVSGPGGIVEQTFGPGDAVVFDLAAMAGDVDGSYTWELTASPNLDADLRTAMAAARTQAAGGERVRPDSLPPRSALVQGGHFTVRDGAIVQPGTESGDQRSLRVSGTGETAPTTNGDVKYAVGETQVITMDLIVQGSECLGQDCTSGESFGFDTLRLKENNTRIKFDDTSNSGSFPNNDWTLVANDSDNGGRNAFYLQDATAGREVFTVEAGAPLYSLYVDDAGRIGMGTNSPVVQAHIKDGNTPTLRLDQDTSSGFNAQIWDIAGNEANFFIRDVTNGSKLSFRIKPGAPESSIFIAASGDVGLGTSSPSDELTIKSDGTANDVLVVQASGASTSNIFRVRENSNQSGLFSVFDSTGEVIRFTGDAGGRVAIGCNAPGAALDIASNTGAACSAATTRSFINAGATTFTASSSRTIKENLHPVQIEGILDKISGIGVFSYDFIEGPKDRLGLMAEDFHQVFNRGSDKLLDGQEVQMAMWLALQELVSQNRALQERVDHLEGMVEETATAQE